MIIRLLTSFILLAGLMACQTKPVTVAVERVEPPSGMVLVREYTDSIKTENGDEYLKVQYLWDYDLNVTTVRQYKLDGTLVKTELEPAMTLETTDAELAYAFQLVRDDPVLGPIANAKGTRMYGGFSMRVANLAPAGNSKAEQFCRAKTRCIHIIMSGGKDGELNLGHAIVDLASRQVIDRDYQPMLKQPSGSNNPVLMQQSGSTPNSKAEEKSP